MRPAGGRITVKELLAQRSRLPDYLADSRLSPTGGRTPLGKVWTSRQLLRLASSRPLAFAPGTRFGYSNTNYLVLGLIIERVTHTRLERYAQHTIFAPLGMRSTAFVTGRLTGDYAHGYMPYGRPFVPAPGGLGDVEFLNGSRYGPAASLVSTAADLDRFFTALFTGRIIPRSLVSLMQATGPASGVDYQSYGLGLEGSRYACGMAWGHGGAVWGYRAVVRASRNAGTLIVLLVNREFLSLGTKTRAIVNAPSTMYCAN